MTLKDLNLQKKYSVSDEKLNSFYIPALKESKLYWRLAGYFSSNSISKAALGIRTLIENNGTMRLITGVELQADDVKAIKEGTLQTEQAIEKELSAAMEKLNKDDYTLQPAKVLGWMLKNNILESGFTKLDYLEIRGEKDLEEIKTYSNEKSRIFVAAYINDIRLIDNITIE